MKGHVAAGVALIYHLELMVLLLVDQRQPDSRQMDSSRPLLMQKEPLLSTSKSNLIGYLYVALHIINTSNWLVTSFS